MMVPNHENELMSGAHESGCTRNQPTNRNYGREHGDIGCRLKLNQGYYIYHVGLTVSIFA